MQQEQLVAQKVYNHLKLVAASSPEIPSVAQLMTLVACVRKGHSAAEVAEQAGLPVDKVVDLVIDLAAFVLRTESLQKHPVAVYSDKGDTLFGPPGSVELVAARFGAAEGDQASLAIYGGADLNTLFITDDWGGPVSLRSALATLVHFPPSQRSVDRFRLRRYRPGPVLLAQPHLWMLAWLGQTGLYQPVLGNFVEGDYRLAASVLRAWDFYVRSGRRAETAIRRLSEPQLDDLDAIEADTRTALWVAPASAQRLLDAVSSVRIEGASALPLLKSRVSGVRRWRPPMVPFELTSTHAHYLGLSSGLVSDPEVVKATRAGVREFLSSLGASADVDVEVPDAVVAAANGLLEPWQASRRLRAAGDSSWEEAFVAAAQHVFL